MIVVNPSPPPTFQVVRSARPFDQDTYDVADAYGKFLTGLPTNLASEQDRALSQHGRANMQLCHQIAHSEIQRMVLDYLNGDITVNQFMILVGSVMRPSWSNLLFPRTLLMLLTQWMQTIYQRMDIMVAQARANPAQAAVAANSLIHTLNNAIPNLRFGHASTNMSIHSSLDLRLHRGFTLDPYMLVSILLAGSGDVLAAESSAILNDWEGRLVAVDQVHGGAIKSSESSQVVTYTKTRAHNPVMGRSVMPSRQAMRGSARIWLPLSCDSVLAILGCILLYLFVLPHISGEA